MKPYNSISMEEWNSLKVNDELVCLAPSKKIYKVLKLARVNHNNYNIYFLYCYNDDCNLDASYSPSWWAIWKLAPKPSRFDLIDD